MSEHGGNWEKLLDAIRAGVNERGFYLLFNDNPRSCPAQREVGWEEKLSGFAAERGWKIVKLRNGGVLFHNPSLAPRAVEHLIGSFNNCPPEECPESFARSGIHLPSALSTLKRKEAEKAENRL